MQTWRFWLLVLLIVILLVYAIMSIQRRPVPYFEKEIAQIWVGNIEFDFLTGLYFLKEGKDVYLRGSMPDSQQMNGQPTHCGKYNRSKSLCATWFHDVKLQVDNSVEEHGTCQTLTWTSQIEKNLPQTCFSLSDVRWYGGSLMKVQNWPLNKAELPLQPYTLYNGEKVQNDANAVENVLDWFWISSAGVAVIADSSVPLKVSINQSGDKLLCLHSQTSFSPSLKYTICKSDNLRKIQRYVLSKFVHLPTTQPKEEFFNSPAWSTYPLFRDSLDQGKLLKYGLEVKDKEYERSFLDINNVNVSMLRKDPFLKSKFPNSHQSLMYLRDYGFKLILSISPFVPVSEDIDHSLLVADVLQNPVVFKYSGVDVYVLNLESENAVAWLSERMKAITVEYTLDGFHLDGDLSVVSSVFSYINTYKYLRNFANIAADLKTQIISRFAIKSQSSIPMIQLSSKVSSWGYDGGLRSVIPSVLTLGILGYPFVIPNVIGGPGQLVPGNATADVKSVLPDRLLYIRWLGLAAYMPCMMYSVPPWMYDDEVVTIAHHFSQIHKDKVAHLVTKAAREFEISGKGTFVVLISIYYEFAVLVKKY